MEQSESNKPENQEPVRAEAPVVVVSTKKPQPAQVLRQKFNAAYMVGFVLLAGVAGYAGSWIESNYGSNDNPLAIITAKDDGNNVVTASEENIAAVAKKVSPSVVSILSSSTQLSFFNQPVQQEAAGTGMIVSKDGYILTNKHVVDGANTVTVVLPGGKTYKNVKVMGTDPLNDIAFLKISGVNDLPAVTLGDSKTVRIGQSVVAIGNALGQYQNTVTSGIISGTGRPVEAGSESGNSATETLNDLIQTDAAINSGNSGGPLLNLKGQVIGINTAIAADAQGIGFSIPIGAAKGMLANLIRTGKLERPYLGIQYISITAEVKEQYKLSTGTGDYVFATSGPSVQSGGPCRQSGHKR
jgi:serine protease Do